MATLDTTRLIQPALTPAPTTTIQPKPAEGFQRLLDDETLKVSNPVPQTKATASVSRPAREASQPAKALQTAKALRSAAKSPNETKARFEQDSTDARTAVKPEGDPAGFILWWVFRRRCGHPDAWRVFAGDRRPIRPQKCFWSDQSS